MSIDGKFDRVMVTGGAGFIGARVVDLLAARGTSQIVVDNGYVGRPLPAERDGLAVADADIRDRDAMLALMNEHRPQAIVHLAAVHHIPTCEGQPHLALDVNVLGTQTLLDCAAEAGVGNVVFTSSGAVYQWCNGLLIESETPTGASDYYSIGKLAGEYQVAHWARRTGGRAHIGRLFNTIGADDPNGHLIPDLLEQLTPGAAHSTVRLGNTRPKRDYIHADEVARGFVALLDGLPEGEPVETFNICSGREASVAELVALLGELVGTEVSIESDPARFRKVDRLQQLGSPDKMTARRGWRAEMTLREALAQIVGALGYRVPGEASRAA